jgi:UDP-N-acetylmuramate--alanine ligase
MVLYSGEHKLGVIHFIGIGGIGISGLAEILYHLGYDVQGSDIKLNSNIERLESFGINIMIGHQASNIDKANYVVISSAISYENAEIIEAHRRKIPVLKRSEMLAELMRFKYSIGISGSHGKTTTTSMIGHLFEYFDLKPTVITGGILNNKNTNAYIGSGSYLIAEADESDGTFTEILSNIAVVTNIDREHLSYYKNFENLKNAFKIFITKIPFYGFAVVCYDNLVVKEIVDQIENRKIIKYGIDSEELNIKALNIQITEFGSTFEVEVNLPWSKKFFTIHDIKINIPGIHNILNSLAAISIAVEKNFEVESIKNSLSNFPGVKRRFTNLGKYQERVIIDDYAHHPEEIKATLKCAKLFAKAKNSNVIGIFQPHRYSRLFDLFDEFVTCFEDASTIFIADIYEAGEVNIYNVDHIKLVDSINLHKKTKNFAYPFHYSNEELLKILDNHTKPGDIIVFMGAGNITNWPHSLIS